MKKYVVVLLLLVVATIGYTQDRTSSCFIATINAKGVSNADVAVSSTAVAVIDASASACSGAIKNTGTGNMRCAAGSLVPTATVGIEVKAGETLTMTYEARDSWRCIRTATDTTANTEVTRE